MYYNVSAITNARFNMRATVLRKGASPVDSETQGSLVRTQNPDTGEIEEDWTVGTGNTVKDASFDIPVQVRSFLDNGYRSSNNIEDYRSGLFDKEETLWVYWSKDYPLSEDDRITNIRPAGSDNSVYTEESSTGLPTVYDIRGIDPVMDAFGYLIEYHSVLRRSDVQA